MWTDQPTRISKSPSYPQSSSVSCDFASSTKVMTSFPEDRGQSSTPKRSVAARVGREEARAAARSHLLQHSALHEGTLETHQLPQPRARRDALLDARVIEIDHERVDALGPFAQQEVLHVKIGVAAAGVMETSDRDARRRRRPE
jgi:hypothetical protein